MCYLLIKIDFIHHLRTKTILRTVKPETRESQALPFAFAFSHYCAR